MQITKEILNDTVNKNSDIAAKLISISPELSGLADILKTEIHASLAIRNPGNPQSRNPQSWQ